MRRDLDRRRNFVARLSEPKVVALTAMSVVGVVAYLAKPITVTVGDIDFAPMFVAGPVIYQIGNNASIPTVTYMSRDAGTEAGGEWMYLVGTNFSDGATVVAGVAATVDSISATDDTLWITTGNYSGTMPAQAFDTVSFIVTNTGGNADTLAGFEYAQAPGTTYVTHDFEDQTDGGFTSGAVAGCASAASATWALNGTYSWLNSCETTGFSKVAHLQYFYSSPTNPATSNTYGVFERYYWLTNQKTIDSVAVSSGQIKTHRMSESRDSTTASWDVTGFGAAFTGCGALVSEITVQRDRDTGCYAGSASDTEWAIPIETWTEWQIWRQRKSSTGTMRIWADGKLIFEIADALNGSDSTSFLMVSKQGITTHEQGATGQIEIWTDDFAIADGFVARTN